MIKPQRVEQTSKKWKIWHSVNYIMGCLSFFIGSILLYPFFAKLLQIKQISAWLYILGSFTFTLADFTQWLHYSKKLLCNKNQSSCKFKSLSLNFLANLTGSIIYLFGSTLFIPSMNQAQIGLHLFIVGSVVIVASQAWKVSRGLKKQKYKKKICEIIKKNTDGLLVDVFVGVGGGLYFAGSLLFFNPARIVQVLAATTFSCGGLLFCISGGFMLHRYFSREKSGKDAKQQNNSFNKIDSHLTINVDY